MDLNSKYDIMLTNLINDLNIVIRPICGFVVI